jgi:hypothetical protein
MSLALHRETPVAQCGRTTARRRAEYFGGGKWHEIISPDGVRCYVTRLWGKIESERGVI